MIRKIIKINQDKCNGCGACAAACHEGAIQMIDGKAVLTREDYCDGLGDCLPACPTNAISFEEREAPAYNEEAVRQAKLQKQPETLPCGCPGTQSRQIQRTPQTNPAEITTTAAVSQLSQWPVQIKLVPVQAPYFDGANLLVAADCPKLDEGDYTDKLTHILCNNHIQSITVVRMEVPCCGGIEAAVKRALEASGKEISCQVVTISTDGRIIH